MAERPTIVPTEIVPTEKELQDLLQHLKDQNDLAGKIIEHSQRAARGEFALVVLSGADPRTRDEK